MKVEVTVCGKPFGSNQVGATMCLTPVQARALVALKRVVYATPNAKTLQEIDDSYTGNGVEAVESVEALVDEIVQPRRRYRTREMKAE